MKSNSSDHKPTHNRRSIRLKGFDYTQPGAYFITLVTQDRACLFGDIQDGCMLPSPEGIIVDETWHELEDRYPYLECDAWIVMPNHVHGILIYQEAPPYYSREAAGGPIKPLGQIVGAFKTMSTKRINLRRGTPGAVVWQRNYYEHIIRNDVEWSRIRQYIAMNPHRWAADNENP